MVDHQGNVVDGDEMLFVIACERRRRNIEFGGVVGTKMSNLGMELALAEREVPFARTAVGDRFVLQEMQQRGWQLGGESSGHIICHDITTTGDGIVSALQVLTAVVLTGKPLRELRGAMQKFPQTMINVRLGQDPMCLPARAFVTPCLALKTNYRAEGVFFAPLRHRAGAAGDGRGRRR